MPRPGQFAIFVAATILLALPGCFLSIVVYLTCSSGYRDLSGSILFAAWLTPSMVLRVSPIVVLLALVSSTFWFSDTRRPLVVILAAAAGVMTAPLSTSHSPHVSLPLAALSTGFVWMTISAIALIARSLPKSSGGAAIS